MLRRRGERRRQDGSGFDTAMDAMPCEDLSGRT